MMAIFLQPYTILLLTSVIISASLAVAALKSRSTLGTHSFAVLMGALCVWAFLNIFEVMSSDISTKTFSGNLKYLSIVAIPSAWFAFSLYYSNRLVQLRSKHLALLAAIPLVTLFMTVTNEFHHFMFVSIEWVESRGLLLPLRKYGSWFWVHTTYSYLMIFLGFLFLAKSILDAHRIFRSQAISLLIAALAPWLCNVFFLFSDSPRPHLDLTPFTFTLSGLAIMWGIMRYRLLDIVPIARNVVIHNMRDGIVVMDTHYRILDVNAAAMTLLEKEQSDLIGRNAEQVIPWWPRMTIEGHFSEMSMPAFIELESSQGIRQIQISVSTLRTRERSSGYLVLLRDITEMKKTQDALQQSEERFKSLSENAPVIILSLDEAGTITYANPAWRVILGYERKETMGQQFQVFVENGSNRTYEQIFNQLIHGSTCVDESNIKLLHKRGEIKNFDMTAAVNSNDEGRITGIIILAKDITEESRLQEQLFQSQKMEAIGTLAGGIAHDFNNLLMGMQANISLMRLEAEQMPSMQNKLSRIEDQIQSGSSLTRQLLGYARKGKYVLAVIDIHQLIEETLTVVQRTNKNIMVNRDLNAAPALIEADKGQMELVLLNLFVNAVDAMSNGGELTVSTLNTNFTGPVPHWPDMKPGPYIEIHVTDTGIGMDQHTMDRIFEPFFTTKEIGRGTGLGLASVYGVVKNHHGDIHVSSAIQQGTTFVLMFPAATHPQLKSVNTSSADEIQCPNGRQVLLVDDEAPILKYIGEMIQSLGYTVLSANSGKAAVKIYENNFKKIDLVVLDMIMPDMNGGDVFRVLKAINPQVRVLIASGYGLNEQSESILGQGPHLMLNKPFTRDELGRTIDKLLAVGEETVCAADTKLESFN